MKRGEWVEMGRGKLREEEGRGGVDGVGEGACCR